MSRDAVDFGFSFSFVGVHVRACFFFWFFPVYCDEGVAAAAAALAAELATAVEISPRQHPMAAVTAAAAILAPCERPAREAGPRAVRV